jgi:hypothetical protein
MKIVDLNVLLYAVNEDSRHHRTVRKAWEALLNGTETVGLAWVVILGFVRLTTSPSVFPRPVSTETALARIDAWLSTEVVRVVGEKDGHWDLLATLLRESGSAGNLTTDAHLAALAISHGATLLSCDTDFARFRGLRWENPLSGARGRARA